jgi:hypothetical protein
MIVDQDTAAAAMEITVEAAAVEAAETAGGVRIDATTPAKRGVV